jgi:hypothetical protein
VLDFKVFAGEKAVAVVTDTGLYRAELEPGTRSFAAPQRLSELAGGRSLVLTDPNDDELPDIVVADQDGLWLLRAQLR